MHVQIFRKSVVWSYSCLPTLETILAETTFFDSRSVVHIDAVCSPRLPCPACMEAVKEAKAAVKEALSDASSFLKETGLLEKTIKLRCVSQPRSRSQR